VRQHVYRIRRTVSSGDLFARGRPQTENVAVRAAAMAAWTVLLLLLLAIIIPVGLLFLVLFLIFALIGKASASVRRIGGGPRRRADERENVRVIPPGERLR